MALDITEYGSMATDVPGNRLPCGQEPAVLTQQVAIGGASAQSAAFNGSTRFIRVHADAACRLAFGADPTASAASMRMAAGSTEYFGVRPGHKLAVITTT